MINGETVTRPRAAEANQFRHVVRKGVPELRKRRNPIVPATPEAAVATAATPKSPTTFRTLRRLKRQPKRRLINQPKMMTSPAWEKAKTKVAARFRSLNRLARTVATITP